MNLKATEIYLRKDGIISHMLTKRGLSKTVLLFLAFLIIVMQSSAIGVEPSKIILLYEPGATGTFTFTGLNYNSKETDVKVSVVGEMKDSITINKESATIPGKGETEFSFTITLPEGLAPGTHQAKILVEEQASPEEFLETGSVFTARSAVALVVSIKVPSPGKYVEVEFGDIKPLNTGETAFMRVIAHNYGEEPITEMKGTIDIHEPDGNLIESIPTTTVPVLNPKDSVELRAMWKSPEDALPGTYKAVANIDYGGKENATAHREFHIGNIFIKIVNVAVANVISNSVAKFLIDIKSEWGNTLNNIYADVIILDGKDKVGEARTNTISLKPLENKRLTAYWETGQLQDKTYNAKVVVNYEGKTTEETVEFKPGLQEVTADVVKGSEVVYLLLGVIIILLLLIIIGGTLIILYLKKRR